MRKDVPFYIIILNILIILIFWYLSSGKLIFSSRIDFLLGIGRLFGLLAVFSVLIQLLLIGRIKWIERAFGLDKLARIHKWNGYATLILMTLHATAIITAYSIINKLSFTSQFINFITTSPYLLAALIGFLLFFIIVALSLTIIWRKLKYETWYYIHLLTYLAILLTAFHQIKLGADFANIHFIYYWYFIYIFVLDNFILYRFIRPLWFYNKHRFYVSEIKEENPNVTSFYISGRNINQFKREAGQFMILRFLARGYWYEAHPFSLSASPEDNILRVTIKNVGDFTSKINLLKPGTKLLIDGLHGTFTKKKAKKNKIALLAGGIGITPIRSLLGSFNKSKDIILLYGNRTKKDIVFKDEIENIAEKNKNKIHYLYSEEKEASKYAIIDRESIENLIPDINERDIYICGPMPMMKSIIKYLKSRNVPSNQIHYEKFSLH